MSFPVLLNPRCLIPTIYALNPVLCAIFETLCVLVWCGHG